FMNYYSQIVVVWNKDFGTLDFIKGFVSFEVVIHLEAKIGCGILLGCGIGFVNRETSMSENTMLIVHHVTLSEGSEQKLVFLEKFNISNNVTIRACLMQGLPIGSPTKLVGRKNNSLKLDSISNLSCILHKFEYFNYVMKR
ncbi:hypothetical protein CR513_14999, partial [Mucuna pruriens]